jgi:hypothetical protein
MCWKLIFAVSIISACASSSKIPVRLRNNKHFLKSRENCGFDQALLPAITATTRQSEQPGRVSSRNLLKCGSLSESAVQAPPKAFSIISAIDVHESTSNQLRIHNITMHGEMKHKAMNRTIQGVDLIDKLDHIVEQIRMDIMSPELPIGKVRCLPTNFSEQSNVLAAKLQELKIESLAFIEQETTLFLQKRTKQTQRLAWNILNFMKSDQAVDLEQWLDADGSRIRVLSEIFGGRPESDVKSSLLDIFDDDPGILYTGKTKLLNDLVALQFDMQLMQDAVGIPAHAVGHAGTVLSNAEAIQCHFPFPLQLRCGASSHFAVRAVARFRALLDSPFAALE